MADDYSAIADPVQAEPDDYSSISTPLDHVDKNDDFSAIATPLKPTSNVVADTGQRLGESLWKGLGSLVGGLDRLEERFMPGSYAALQKNLRKGGLKPVDIGAEIASVADSGSVRTDPARDSGLPAMGAEMVGGAAPAFLLGPLAPVGMGAMTSDQEKRRALTEGESADVAQARGDLGFSVGTAAGMIPVVGKSIIAKTVTGGLGNVAGYAALEKSQGRKLDAKEAAKAFGVGSFFGAGMGVAEKVGSRSIPKVVTEAPKGPSLVDQMDGKSHGTPAEANAAANEIALKPPETPSAAPMPSLEGEGASEKPSQKNIDPALKSYLDELLATGEITADEYKEQAGKAPESKPKSASEDVPGVAPAPLQPVSQSFTIPKDLSKSNPGYSYGENKFQVKFESDLDKALYVLAGEKKSVADGRFLKIVQEATGMTEAEARAAGRTVRAEIKKMAKNGSDGDTLSVPTIHETTDSQQQQGKPPAQVSNQENVDIGPRDASVSTGDGVETSKESKMMEDWLKANEEEAKQAKKEQAEETKASESKWIAVNDKANYEAYTENMKTLGPLSLEYAKDPTNPVIEEAYLKAQEKSEVLKNLNGGHTPVPPHFTPEKNGKRDGAVWNPPPKATASDYASYKSAREAYAEILKKFKSEPDNAQYEKNLQDAQVKMEEIKNRNGGKPPADPYISTLLEKDTFEKEWKKGGEQAGSENQIIIKDGRVYKRNYNEGLEKVYPNHETKAAFDEHLALHNEIFPETALKFEGMSETKGGEAPVVSQAEIKGVEATPKEVRDFMAAKGFEPYSGSAYVNKPAGLRVGDLKGDNVIKDANGVLHVIDPVIKRIEPVAAKHVEFVPQEAQQQQGKPPTQQQNAIPKQKPKSLPVLAQTEAGQAVGEKVRIGRGVEAAKSEEALLRKEEPVARNTSASKPEPSVVKPLISSEGVQNALDDAEVQRIIEDAYSGGGDDGGSGTPPPTGNSGAAASSGGAPYRQGLTKMGLGLGKAAEAFKVMAGTIEGNIRDASKRVFGVLRNYEHAKAQLSLQFEKATMPASRLARKILTKKGNDTIGNLLMSGKIDEAKALVAKDTRYGMEFSHAIDAARASLDFAHKIMSEARDNTVTYLQNYFPRQMISYAEFRKFLGKEELAIADQAIRRAQEKSETPLTQEQVEAVVNDLISQSRRGGGKPGFLKERTVKEIDSNISRFYEPWDVALENYLRKVTNDVVNRAYFGKFDPESGAIYNPANGHFGKVIAEEIGSGRLKGKAQEIVIDNLKDRFKMEQNVQGLAADFGRKIRWAQSAAYLGQIQTAVAQFGDVFGSILHQGPIDTAMGYIAPRFKLRDIGIHEGNVETAQFSRRRGLVDKASDLTIKFGVGLSDQFNKGGVANAIARHYTDVVRDPTGDAFLHLNRDYSAKFPDQWPKMLNELQTKAFAEGRISELPNAQFFLYNEMSDIHPINPSGMAQGYNAAHPLAKPFWGLKSYMIKQLDIMRARGYERVKTPGQRGEGLAYLAAYAAVVAAGQNFAVSWIRDKLANRQTDTSDYFIGGFLQPLGISRYTITQLKQGEVGKAMIETALPIVSLGREVINDAGLTRDLVIQRRDRKTRQRTVKDIGDLVSQSELVKHFPVIGSVYYSRFGKGAAKEKERQSKKARGISQPNTFETIKGIAAPEETAGHR